MSTAVAEAAVAAGTDSHPNQFALLKQRRFAPFFWTQFAGAANDNLLRLFLLSTRRTEPAAREALALSCPPTRHSME